MSPVTLPVPLGLVEVPYSAQCAKTDLLSKRPLPVTAQLVLHTQQAQSRHIVTASRFLAARASRGYSEVVGIP